MSDAKKDTIPRELLGLCIDMEFWHSGSLSKRKLRGNDLNLEGPNQQRKKCSDILESNAGTTQLIEEVLEFEIDSILKPRCRFILYASTKRNEPMTLIDLQSYTRSRMNLRYPFLIFNGLHYVQNVSDYGSLSFSRIKDEILKLRQPKNLDITMNGIVKGKNAHVDVTHLFSANTSCIACCVIEHVALFKDTNLEFHLCVVINTVSAENYTFETRRNRGGPADSNKPSGCFVSNMSCRLPRCNENDNQNGTLHWVIVFTIVNGIVEPVLQRVPCTMLFVFNEAVLNKDAQIKLVLRNLILRNLNMVKLKQLGKYPIKQSLEQIMLEVCVSDSVTSKTNDFVSSLTCGCWTCCIACLLLNSEYKHSNITETTISSFNKVTINILKPFLQVTKQKNMVSSAPKKSIHDDNVKIATVTNQSIKSAERTNVTKSRISTKRGDNIPERVVGKKVETKLQYVLLKQPYRIEIHDEMGGFRYIGCCIRYTPADKEPITKKGRIWKYAVIKYWEPKCRAFFIHGINESFYEIGSSEDVTTTSVDEQALLTSLTTLDPCQTYTKDVLWIATNSSFVYLICNEPVFDRNAAFKPVLNPKPHLGITDQNNDICAVCNQRVLYIKNVNNLDENVFDEEQSAVNIAKILCAWQTQPNALFHNPLHNTISAIRDLGMYTERSLISMFNNNLDIVRMIIKQYKSEHINVYNKSSLAHACRIINWIRKFSGIKGQITADRMFKIVYWGVKCSTCNEVYHAKCLPFNHLTKTPRKMTKANVSQMLGSHKHECRRFRKMATARRILHEDFGSSSSDEYDDLISGVYQGENGKASSTGNKERNAHTTMVTTSSSNQIVLLPMFYPQDSFDCWNCETCSLCVYCCLPIGERVVPYNRQSNIVYNDSPHSYNLYPHSFDDKLDRLQRNCLDTETIKSVRCVSCNLAAHRICCNTYVPNLVFIESWKCDWCCQCISCGYKDISRSDYLNWGLFFLFCLRCWSSLEKSNYCGICYQIWTNYDSVTQKWVQCDGCKLWVHVECDIVAKELTECSSSRCQSYRCQTCRCPDKIHRCWRVLEQVFLLDKLNQFRYPVSASCVVYWRLVTKPMDLTTLRRKLENGVYNTINEFIFDILLIPYNAKMVNMPNTKIYKLSVIFERKCKQCITGIMQMTMAEIDAIFDLGTTIENIEKNISKDPKIQGGNVYEEDGFDDVDDDLYSRTSSGGDSTILEKKLLPSKSILKIPHLAADECADIDDVAATKRDVLSSILPCNLSKSSISSTNIFPRTLVPCGLNFPTVLVLNYDMKLRFNIFNDPVDSVNLQELIKSNRVLQTTPSQDSLPTDNESKDSFVNKVAQVYFNLSNVLTEYCVVCGSSAYQDFMIYCTLCGEAMHHFCAGFANIPSSLALDNFKCAQCNKCCKCESGIKCNHMMDVSNVSDLHMASCLGWLPKSTCADLMSLYMHSSGNKDVFASFVNVTAEASTLPTTNNGGGASEQKCNKQQQLPSLPHDPRWPLDAVKCVTCAASAHLRCIYNNNPKKVYSVYHKPMVVVTPPPSAAYVASLVFPQNKLAQLGLPLNKECSKTLKPEHLPSDKHLQDSESYPGINNILQRDEIVSCQNHNRSILKESIYDKDQFSLSKNDYRLFCLTNNATLADSANLKFPMDPPSSVNFDKQHVGMRIQNRNVMSRQLFASKSVPGMPNSKVCLNGTKKGVVMSNTLVKTFLNHMKHHIKKVTENMNVNTVPNSTTAGIVNDSCVSNLHKYNQIYSSVHPRNDAIVDSSVILAVKRLAKCDELLKRIEHQLHGLNHVMLYQRPTLNACHKDNQHVQNKFDLSCCSTPTLPQSTKYSMNKGAGATVCSSLDPSHCKNTLCMSNTKAQLDYVPFVGQTASIAMNISNECIANVLQQRHPQNRFINDSNRIWMQQHFEWFVDGCGNFACSTKCNDAFKMLKYAVNPSNTKCPISSALGVTMEQLHDFAIIMNIDFVSVEPIKRVIPDFGVEAICCATCGVMQTSKTRPAKDVILNFELNRIESCSNCSTIYAQFCKLLCSDINRPKEREEVLDRMYTHITSPECLREIALMRNWISLSENTLKYITYMVSGTLPRDLLHSHILELVRCFTYSGSYKKLLQHIIYDSMITSPLSSVMIGFWAKSLMNGTICNKFTLKNDDQRVNVRLRMLNHITLKRYTNWVLAIIQFYWTYKDLLSFKISLDEFISKTILNSSSSDGVPVVPHSSDNSTTSNTSQDQINLLCKMWTKFFMYFIKDDKVAASDTLVTNGKYQNANDAGSISNKRDNRRHNNHLYFRRHLAQYIFNRYDYADFDVLNRLCCLPTEDEDANKLKATTSPALITSKISFEAETAIILKNEFKRFLLHQRTNKCRCKINSGVFNINMTCVNPSGTPFLDEPGLQSGPAKIIMDLKRHFQDQVSPNDLESVHTTTSAGTWDIAPFINRISKYRKELNGIYDKQSVQIESIKSHLGASLLVKVVCMRAIVGDICTSAISECNRESLQNITENNKSDSILSLSTRVCSQSGTKCIPKNLSIDACVLCGLSCSTVLRGVLIPWRNARIHSQCLIWSGDSAQIPRVYNINYNLMYDDSDDALVQTGIDKMQLKTEPKSIVHFNINLLHLRLLPPIYIPDSSVEDIVQESLETVCTLCNRSGASIPCMNDSCKHTWHYSCAMLGANLQVAQMYNKILYTTTRVEDVYPLRIYYTHRQIWCKMCFERLMEENKTKLEQLVRMNKTRVLSFLNTEGLATNATSLVARLLLQTVRVLPRLVLYPCLDDYMNNECDSYKQIKAMFDNSMSNHPNGHQAVHYVHDILKPQHFDLTDSNKNGHNDGEYITQSRIECIDGYFIHAKVGPTKRIFTIGVNSLEPEPPVPLQAARIGTLTVFNIGDTLSYGEDDFLYPLGYTAVRIFWNESHVHARLSSSTSHKDENNYANQIKQRRSAYLCLVAQSNNGPCFSIYVLRLNSSCLISTGTNIHSVYKFFIIHLGFTNGIESVGMDAFTFFGLNNHFVIQTLRESLAKILMIKAVQFCRLSSFCDALSGKQIYDSTSVSSSRTGSRVLMGTCERNFPFRIRKYALAEIVQVVLDFKNSETSCYMDASDARGSRSRARKQYDTYNHAIQYRYLVSLPPERRLEVRYSSIHGFGLFATEDITAGEPVIEYVGELIRDVIGDMREELYSQEQGGDGSCYMFRLDDQLIVDATRRGTMSRFINHSCDPNCLCRIITCENGLKHIVIFAKCDLKAGDEITYDYQFGVESETRKLTCLCGSSNCLGRMN